MLVSNGPCAVTHRGLRGSTFWRRSISPRSPSPCRSSTALAARARSPSPSSSALSPAAPSASSRRRGLPPQKLSELTCSTLTERGLGAIAPRAPAPPPPARPKGYARLMRARWQRGRGQARLAFFVRKGDRLGCCQACVGPAPRWRRAACRPALRATEPRLVDPCADMCLESRKDPCTVHFPESQIWLQGVPSL